MADLVTKADHREETRLPSVLALTATAVLWGSNHVAARAIHATLPLPSLIFWRWGLALVVLLPIALPGLLRERRVIRLHARRIAFLGCVGVGLFSVCLYAGAYFSLALEVGLLNTTTPIWVLIIAAVTGSARPRAAEVGGVAIALFGVLLVLLKGNIAEVSTFHLGLGNLSSLLAALFFAFYTYSLGQYPLKISALSLTTLTALAGFLFVFVPVYVLFLIYGGSDPIFDDPRLDGVSLAVLYIAIGPTLLGNLFWIYGASRLGASNAGAFLYISPLAALVLSTSMLGESFTLLQFVGGIAILCGLWLSSRRTGSWRAGDS